MAPILLFICRIGQGQLIRRQIAYTLQLGCQLDAHMLYQTLDTFNTSLMNDVIQHYRHPEASPYPSNENPILVETATLLQACGLEDPLDKVNFEQNYLYNLRNPRTVMYFTIIFDFFVVLNLFPLHTSY